MLRDQVCSLLTHCLCLGCALLPYPHPVGKGILKDDYLLKVLFSL